MPSLVGGIPGSSSRLSGGLAAIGPMFVSDVSPAALQRIPPSLDQRVGKSAPVVFGYAGAGGLVFAGAAPVARVKAYTPAGGLAFAGSALLARVKAFTPSGGLTFAGAALRARTRAFTPAGGIVFGGAAVSAITAAPPAIVGREDRRPSREKRRHEDDLAVILAALMRRR